LPGEALRGSHVNPIGGPVDGTRKAPRIDEGLQ